MANNTEFPTYDDVARATTTLGERAHPTDDEWAAEDGGSAGTAQKTGNPPVAVSSAAEGVSGSFAPKPPMAAEATDLERRVLAHERILQSLIAHMAETEPQFLARLSAMFREPMLLSRREHDYTDTDAYAEQFICEVARMVERPHRSAPAPGPQRAVPQPPSVPTIVAAADSRRSDGVTRFKVRQRMGVWEVTRDGRFYGDYFAKDHAVDAATVAARAVVTKGGAADVDCLASRPSAGI
jgi:hypothetical protein